MSDDKRKDESKPIKDEQLDEVSGGREAGVGHPIAYGPPPERHIGYGPDPVPTTHT